MIDHVVSAFGLKTLSSTDISRLFLEVSRILRPDGTFSFLEISVPSSGLLRVPYNFYLSYIIPVVGRILLGDVDCYRMLGRYTNAFGECGRIAERAREVGLEVSVRSHFFGCATSLVGVKPVEQAVEPDL